MAHHPKTRHPHKEPIHLAGEHKKQPISATLKMTLIFAFLGLVAAALASQLSIYWMLCGLVAGAIGGFLIGMGIDRAAAKKR